MTSTHCIFLIQQVCSEQGLSSPGALLVHKLSDSGVQDKDQRISRSEWEQANRTSAEFDEVDRNKDHFISPDEFAQVYKQSELLPYSCSVRVLDVVCPAWAGVCME